MASGVQPLRAGKSEVTVKVGNSWDSWAWNALRGKYRGQHVRLSRLEGLVDWLIELLHKMQRSGQITHHREFTLLAAKVSVAGKGHKGVS